MDIFNEVVRGFKESPTIPVPNPIIGLGLKLIGTAFNIYQNIDKNPFNMAF